MIVDDARCQVKKEKLISALASRFPAAKADLKGALLLRAGTVTLATGLSVHTSQALQNKGATRLENHTLQYLCSFNSIHKLKTVTKEETCFQLNWYSNENAVFK